MWAIRSMTGPTLEVRFFSVSGVYTGEPVTGSLRDADLPKK
jgi:hypothetical protein